MKYNIAGRTIKVFNNGETAYRVFFIKDNTNMKYLHVVLEGDDHYDSYKAIINLLETSNKWEDVKEFSEENFLEELNK